MKTIKTIQFVLFILFMFSLYVGFIYTLSMLTEVTQLNFFTDFLDPSVTVYVAEAQKVNQSLFDLSLMTVVGSALLYTFKIGKKAMKVKKTIVIIAVGIGAFIVHFISYQSMVALNELYQVTNTSWPASFPNLFGYEEPGNQFVGAGPQIYLWLMLVSVIFVLTFVTTWFINLKESTHETSR